MELDPSNKKDDATLPPVENLKLSDNTTADPNPWSDKQEHEAEVESGDAPERVLHTPDPSSLDPSITAGLAAETPTPTTFEPPNSDEILNEFDPLAHQEEKDARDAWATSEGHPPPPRTPSPPPKPPAKDEPPNSPETPLQSGSSSSSGFPSLAALARTFSIPALARSRPQSLDAAKSVPSPNTLSSFATHQQDQPQGGANSVREGTPSRSNTPNVRGRESPAQGGREQGDPPFDFQKFLDQMKTRSADPVSKYLKSYASSLTI